MDDLILVAYSSEKRAKEEERENKIPRTRTKEQPLKRTLQRPILGT